MITNLVTNAITHTGERGLIVLAAKREGEQAVVRVRDDGCGIPPDELPRVFERFYRGANERAAAPEGSGLGLAIASSLLTAMDATIDVHSVPADGTTFTIRLPLARAPEETLNTEPVMARAKLAAVAATLRPD